MFENIVIRRRNSFLLKNSNLRIPLLVILISLVLIFTASVFIYYWSFKHHAENGTPFIAEESDTDDASNEGEDNPTGVDPDSDEITDENGDTDKEGTTGNDRSDDKDEPNPKPEPIPEPEPEPEPAPEAPSAVVAFYSDSQSDTDEEDAYHQTNVNHILSSGANPVFFAGDLMEDGTQASLDRFNAVTATLRATRTFYAALGNNDRLEGDPGTPSPLWFANFSFPNNEQWYSINYGNLHVVVLDSAFSSGSGTQLSWLANDLQSEASQSRITCVMYHHPSFDSAVSSYFVSYGVDFVVRGHLHSYSHSTANGINYFVLSGQPSIGYMRAKVFENHVEITVYNNGGSVIDTINFNER